VNGKTYSLGPGSVGFVRSNDVHGVKNVGTHAGLIILWWRSVRALVELTDLSYVARFALG